MKKIEAIIKPHKLDDVKDMPYANRNCRNDADGG